MRTEQDSIGSFFKAFEGKFSPDDLRAIGFGPHSTLTTVDLNNFVERVQAQLSFKRRFPEKIRAIDKSLLEEMLRHLAASAVEEFAAFDEVVYQREAFAKYDRGDNTDAAQDAASNAANDRFNELLHCAEAELTRLEELRLMAVLQLEASI